MIQKQLYFTSENRIEKVHHWLFQCAAVKNHRPFNLAPARAALFVLDMQDYFLDPASHAHVPSGPAIIPTVNRLIDWAKTNHKPVILTRHVDKSDSTGMMDRWWGGRIAENAPAARLNRQLAVAPPIMTPESAMREIQTGIWLLTKHHYSAFWQTPLDATLRELNISQIIITGLMTHLCCESTAREAFMRDYEVIVPADATATYTEELHLGSLRAIAHGFGVCVASEEILAWGTG
jgi:isochorismate hydrolase